MHVIPTRGRNGTAGQAIRNPVGSARKPRDSHQDETRGVTLVGANNIGHFVFNSLPDEGEELRFLRLVHGPRQNDVDSSDSKLSSRNDGH